MGRILSLDVALAATGWVLVELAPTLPERIIKAGVIISKPVPQVKVDKRRARIRRVELLAEELMGVLGLCREPAISLLVGELPAGSQHYNSALAEGIVYGVLGALHYWVPYPAVWVTPQEVKRATTGSFKASKEQVQEVILGIWPEVGSAKGFEHIADALGALMAARDSELYRMVAQIGGESGALPQSGAATGLSREGETGGDTPFDG